MGCSALRSPPNSCQWVYQGEWCSLFATWVWTHAVSGAHAVKIDGALLSNPALAPNFYSYGTAHGTFTQGVPKVGDAVVFPGTMDRTKWGEQCPGIQHVEIVVSVDTANGTMKCIGGNETNGLSQIDTFPYAVGSPVWHYTNGPNCSGEALVGGFISPVGI
jgi:hypothetical protein